jgi:hypothetical protein
MSVSKEKIRSYPFTEMFSVIDTIPVPHPYCIGARHLAESKSFYLDIEEAIEEAERRGARCCTCKELFRKGKIPKVLTYKEHKQALLIEVRDPEDRDLKEVPGLQEYLLSIKEQTEKDGFAGWTFVKGS